MANDNIFRSNVAKLCLMLCWSIQGWHTAFIKESHGTSVYLPNKMSNNIEHQGSVYTQTKINNSYLLFKWANTLKFGIGWQHL